MAHVIPFSNYHPAKTASGDAVPPAVEFGYQGFWSILICDRCRRLPYYHFHVQIKIIDNNPKAYGQEVYWARFVVRDCDDLQNLSKILHKTLCVYRPPGVEHYPATKNVSTWTADDTAEIEAQLSSLGLSEKDNDSDAPRAIYDEEDALEEGKLNEAAGGEAAAAELEASGGVMIEVKHKEDDTTEEAVEAMELIARAMDLLDAKAESGELEEERMVLLDDNEQPITGGLKGFRL